MRRLLLVALAGLLLSAAPATADTQTDIFRDCQDDGQLSGDYTAQQLRGAQKNLPDDLREYSDCEDVLRRGALTGSGSGGTNNGGGGGSDTGGGSGVAGGGSGSGGGSDVPLAPETDADRAALDGVQDAGRQPLSVGEGNGRTTIVPAVAGSDTGSSDLPTALVVALVLLGLAGVALSVPPLKRRLRPS